jgi:hypothetical protein
MEQMNFEAADLPIPANDRVEPDAELTVAL